MPLGEMGAFLLFLAVIFVFGNKNPPMWHRFPVYKDEND